MQTVFKLPLGTTWGTSSKLNLWQAMDYKDTNK